MPRSQRRSKIPETWQGWTLRLATLYVMMHLQLKHHTSPFVIGKDIITHPTHPQPNMAVRCSSPQANMIRAWLVDAGVYQGRVTEGLGDACLDDVCDPDCSGGHSFFFVKVLRKVRHQAR